MPLVSFNETKSRQNLNRSKTVLTNSRSVCSKAPLIQHYFMDNDRDIMFIPESHLKEHDTALINNLVPNTHSIIHCRRKKNRKKIDEYKEERSTFELLECDFGHNNKSFKVAIMYRPPPLLKKTPTAQQFLEELEPYMIDKSTCTNHFILLGDFNIHVNKPDDAIAADLLNLMQSCNMIQHVHTATHVKGNILDLVFSRADSTIIQELLIEDNHRSDHCFVSFQLNVEKPIRERRQLEYRKFKKIDFAELKDDIQKKNLVSLVEHEPTIDGKVLVWNKSMLDIPKTALFTEEISQKKRERRRAEGKWRRTRLTSDKDMFWAAKTATNKAITLAKTTYMRETLATNIGNSKDLWKIVNGLTKSATCTSTLPEHLQKSELAERVDVQKISKIRKDLDKDEITEIPPAQPTTQVSVLTNFQPTTIQEVKEVVMKAPDKSCSLDPIRTSLVKSCIDELAPSLASIVNCSLQSAVSPSTFKEAIVTPLLKKTKSRLRSSLKLWSSLQS